MADLERNSAEVEKSKNEQDISLKTEPQPKPGLDETLSWLTKRIAKGGGITLAGSGFGRIVQFGFHILLGRVLGAGGYGLYALGLSIIQLATQTSILGLENGIVRFVALYKGKGDFPRVKGTLVSAFAIATIASLVVGVLLFLGSGFISVGIFNDPQLAPILQIFALAVPFFVLVQMAAHAARGFERMEYYVGIENIVWPVANALLVGAVFLLGYRLTGAVYGFLASAALSGAIGLLFLSKKVFPEGSSLQPDYAIKRLLRFSLPVVFIGFGQLIFTQTDRLMVGYFMTSTDVGVYSAAARIAIQTNFIITAFNTAFAPMIADLYNQRRIGELGELFKLVTRWILALSLPLVLILILFPEPIMGLFGGEFIWGSGVLITLAAAFLINVATGSVGLILIMSGKQDVELANILSMAAVNVGLNIWLIQVYGILGAAIATGLSIAIVNIIRLIEVGKLIGIQPYTRKYLKPLLSGVAVALLLKFLTDWGGIDLHWALGLALCPLLYIGVIVLLGVEKEDRMIVKIFQRKISLLF